MKVFLDDERDPFDNTWVVVRSYKEFVKLIATTPHIITTMSFDHDLGTESDGTTEAENGKAAANKYIEKAMDDPAFGQMLERVNVHSSNPGGAKNIESYFLSAKKHDVINPEVIVTRRQYKDGMG